MQIFIKWIVSCLFLINLSMGYADSERTSEWFSKDSTGITLNVNLFLSSTCEHCHKADAFFQELEHQLPWVSVHRYIINDDKPALKFFYEQLQHVKSNNFSVPTWFFCDSRWSGFHSAQTTGIGIVRALNYCRQQIEKEGKLKPVAVKTLRQWSGTNSEDISFDMNKTGLTPLERLVTTALAEAISPCSLFCLFLFLGFLWTNSQSRLRQFAVGMTFIATLGLIRYFNFAASIQYQQVISHWAFASMFAGTLLLLYVLVNTYASLQERVGRYVGWFFPLIIITTSVVYVNQQDCNFSVGAVFQQWLQTQSLTTAAYYFYQFSYMSIYLFALFLVLIFFVLVNKRPRQLLSYTAYILLASTGLLLLMYPKALTNFMLSSLILFYSFLIAWIFVRRKNRLGN